jgi:hypothetical protein
MWKGYVAHTEQIRNAYKILVKKPNRNRSVRGPRYSWEDTIKLDLMETGHEGLD